MVTVAYVLRSPDTERFLVRQNYLEGWTWTRNQDRAHRFAQRALAQDLAEAWGLDVVDVTVSSAEPDRRISSRSGKRAKKLAPPS